MKKRIKINKSQSIELNSSLGWLYRYREQFGHDILPDLMPALESMLGLAAKAFTGGDYRNILDDDNLAEFMITVSGMETTTLLGVVWALAKNADDDLDDPETFFNSFDAFPIDTVIPEAFRMIANSSISSKNVKRLLTRIAQAKASLSTGSPSQESTEG